ncbi:hypothetical protein N7447_008888 [Penicillium robsamsonii]|uniref:uncharacterized protein n=1 Tax=Penicillium robsamsonii TaxID=1792511 RepID=UPI002549334A|nr:uncharacterized protein N7447_008888 [Penicillium robsamsonii]KAJ5816655.1 hypothetical protein N7447_008888 [Penicillium robsamsonii]
MSSEGIRKPHVRARRGGGHVTTVSSQRSVAQTPSAHDAFDPSPPSSAASIEILLTSPTQELMSPGGYEPRPIAKLDTVFKSSSLQPAADADIETNTEQEAPDVDKKPSESLLPVGTTSPTITALRAVILRSRITLADEEKKYDVKAAPESNEVLRVKNKLDTLETKLEDIRWEYERAKAASQAHEQTRVAFRTRHRELDEAERELEELYHSEIHEVQ